MLSISAMSAGSGSYYLDLAREDYYLSGGEPDGRWWGSGAAVLGLEGRTVERQALENLLAGCSPDGSRPLVQLQTGRTHQPGWDLTFSAPKSVSVLWGATSDDGVQRAIRHAHESAVGEALRFLELDSAATRRGEGGSRREPAKLVAACFEHGTSRAQDPQLHTHVLVMNVAARRDGTFGTIVSRDLYRAKMVAGAIYRAALAHELRRSLGLPLRREKTWFEVRGVPKRLLQAFSKRREAIEAFLAEGRGPATARAAELAALATREVKGHASRAELFERWRSEARSYGLSPGWFERLLRPSRAARTPDAARTRELVFREVPRAVAEITATESTFTRAWLIRAIAERLAPHGVPPRPLIASVDDALKHQPDIVRLSDQRPLYSTHAVLNDERALLGAVEKLLQNRGAHPVSAAMLDGAIRSLRVEPTDEQRSALSAITVEDGPALKLLQGAAGAGKTTVLAAAATAWKRSGYRVLGCALSGKAAMELERASGIKSSTLAKFLWRANPKPRDRVLHDGRQLIRAARRWGTSAFPSLRLTPKTVVVLDEAGMVGTSMFRELAEACARKGAKLVCVGDKNQLQPVDAGGPFASLLRRLGPSAELKTMLRVQERSTSEALRHLVDGDAKTALSILSEAKRLHVSRTSRDSLAALVDAWASRCDRVRRSWPLVLTGTREEAAAANLAMQARRLEGGATPLPAFARVRSFRLPSTRAPIVRLLAGREEGLPGYRFHEGDRVLFSRNDAKLAVRNGDLGVIEHVKRGLTAATTAVTVRLDRTTRKGLVTAPIRVTFTLGEYNRLELGYAVTTHKAQGATVDGECLAWLTRAFAEAREVSYVQLSRARGGARLFVDEQQFGEDLALLHDSMARSRVKQLALDAAEGSDRRHPHRFSPEHDDATTRIR